MGVSGGDNDDDSHFRGTQNFEAWFGVPEWSMLWYPEIEAWPEIWLRSPLFFVLKINLPYGQWASVRWEVQ